MLDLNQSSICLCRISLGTTGTWWMSSCKKYKTSRTSNLELERDSLICHMHHSAEFWYIDRSGTEWKNNPVNLYRKTERTRLASWFRLCLWSERIRGNLQWWIFICYSQSVVLGEVGSCLLICWDFLELKDICSAEKSMQELFQGHIPQIPSFSRPEIQILESFDTENRKLSIQVQQSASAFC